MVSVRRVYEKPPFNDPITSCVLMYGGVWPDYYERWLYWTNYKDKGWTYVNNDSWYKFPDGSVKRIAVHWSEFQAVAEELGLEFKYKGHE